MKTDVLHSFESVSSCVLGQMAIGELFAKCVFLIAHYYCIVPEHTRL